MPENSNIEWTENTWNAFSGCFEVSEGCDNCYAKTISEHKRGTKAFPNGFDLTLRPHKIRDPLRWKTPSRVFVNSMSDLFLGGVPEEYLKSIWDVMLEANWHQYQILTKRPIPMARKIRDLKLELAPHIWLGVSVENQRWADERIPLLLEVPAKIKFLSCEPLLGPLDLTEYLHGLHWVIDGGESGEKRRYAEYEWFSSIRDQCLERGVPYFHKQGNAYYSGRDRLLEGRTYDEYPLLMSDIRNSSFLFRNQY